MKICIIKTLDKLGRVVIPIALRKRYFLNDEVEIIATEEGLLLRKPDYCFTKGSKKEKQDT